MRNAYSVSRMGVGREVNQDSVLCEPEQVGYFPNLYIVADGMGGYRGGDVASRFCVSHVKERLAAMPEGASPVTAIRDAIGETNRMIRQMAAEDETRTGMGTTIVLATRFGDVLYVANVGDSRLYLKHQGRIRQITEDHSLVEAMVQNGELSRENARFHPNKNIITRALGATPEVEIDFFEVPVTKGDFVLMCSDGLSNMLDDQTLEAQIGSGEELEAICERLADMAKDAGGKDDISLVLVHIGA